MGLRSVMSRNSILACHAKFLILLSMIRDSIRSDPDLVDAAFATEEHYEINHIRKVTHFKNVPLSAESTVNYSRLFIANETSR